MIFVQFSVILFILHHSSATLTKQYDKTIFLDDKKSVKFSWRYEVSQDELFYGLEVNATGWVGFGFAEKIDKMQNYDVTVGKVVNGKAIISDRHTVGYQEPLVDFKQDCILTNHEEVNGTTTFEFHRKRITGDSKDLEIKFGPILLVYAYHSTADYPYPYKSQHDHQGYKTVEVLPWDTQLPSNATTAVIPPTTKEILHPQQNITNEDLDQDSNSSSTQIAAGRLRITATILLGVAITVYNVDCI